MTNEYYGAASTPNEDFLAHYGVKGMKWGVRKAIERGNSRALARQYRKASRKLAKLEKRAANGKKYAKRAAALGLGAAAAGGAAVAGTEGVASAARWGKGAAGYLTKNAGLIAAKTANAMRAHGIRGAGKIGAAGTALYNTGRGLERTANTAGTAISAFGKGRVNNAITKRIGTEGAKLANTMREHGVRGAGRIGEASTRMYAKGISNNTLARIGAAGVGAGLAAGAGYNAYRAATTKRAAKKAAQFRSEMNKAFAGTKYANGGSGSSGRSKKRRNRRG